MPGAAVSPDWQAATLRRLDCAELVPRGYLAGASNSTLLCDLVGADEEGTDVVAAVYKPRAGERPLWDFPRGTLADREVAAYLVSQMLGWGIVPPTVLREGPAGVGSVQAFVPHDPRVHYFMLVEDECWHAELARIAVFDMLINNTDRKGSHILVVNEGVGAGSLRGIDHGVTFHPQPKLRTVVWDLGARPFEASWHDDLRLLAEQLRDPDGGDAAQLCDLLSPREVAVTAARAEALLGMQRLPDLDEGRRPYPWPPL